MKNANPFSTISNAIDKSYIDTHVADEIVDTFSDSKSGIHLYRISGLPKSGKTTTFNRAINTFKKKKNWCVCSITDLDNPISFLISEISKCPQVEQLKETICANQYPVGANFKELINITSGNNINVLIGIDDMVKTTGIVQLISTYESLILDKQKIYLLYTGSEENIKELIDEPSISFFARSDSVETEPLNRDAVSKMYQTYLHVSEEESIRMSEITNGYAYAYRVLGNLYYGKSDNTLLENLLPELDEILAKSSYNKIWKTLTKAEKEFIQTITSNSGDITEIKRRMNNPENFDAMKMCLLRRHLINIKSKECIRIVLPRFEEFVKRSQSNKQDVFNGNAARNNTNELTLFNDLKEGLEEAISYKKGIGKESVKTYGAGALQESKTQKF